MAREEQGRTHAQALGALTTRLDEDSGGSDTQKHAIAVLTERLAQVREDHARQFAQQSAELAARLAAEREAARAAERAERAAQVAREERLQQMLAGAERTLAAMQAERQALTAQLAELRLHLLRQASGDAIHRAPGI
jgi:septal ring factor EnvC (AmiA/AmiB activator)